MIIKTVKYLQEAIDIFKSRVEDLWPRFVMVDILRRAGGRSESCARSPDANRSRSNGSKNHPACKAIPVETLYGIKT